MGTRRTARNKKEKIILQNFITQYYFTNVHVHVVRLPCRVVVFNLLCSQF